MLKIFLPKIKLGRETFMLKLLWIRFFEIWKNHLKSIMLSCATESLEKLLCFLLQDVEILLLNLIPKAWVGQYFFLFFQTLILYMYMYISGRVQFFIIPAFQETKCTWKKLTNCLLPYFIPLLGHKNLEIELSLQRSSSHAELRWSITARAGIFPSVELAFFKVQFCTACINLYTRLWTNSNLKK